jgi:predicted nucleic acid-binding protein
LQKELFNHLPKIRTYTKLNDNDLFELIHLVESRIFFVDEELLPVAIIATAKDLVSDIDFNDFAFVALTNHLNGLLWTGDKALISGLKQKNYTQIITTLELQMLLEKSCL